MASPSKKHFMLRLDPTVHDALQRWANDDMRSLNAQIEFLLREAMRRSGRKPAAPRKNNSPQNDSSEPSE